uniref:C-type lectin domain-containing protein n=1 Tax=Spermophilus dauricus TaxID=99837 RepID=A0A8C9ULU1_SPEDA
MLSTLPLSSMSWMLLSCLMLLSQVQDEIPLPRSLCLSPRISCPRGSKAYASHCYALFTTPKTWIDAALACQKWSEGHLASVLSEAEAQFLSSLVKRCVNSYQYGQEPNGAGWEWSSTDVLNYINWERNPSTASDRGYYGSVSRNSAFLKWRDYSCDRELPYVCKFKN